MAAAAEKFTEPTLDEIDNSNTNVSIISKIAAAANTKTVESSEIAGVQFMNKLLYCILISRYSMLEGCHSFRLHQKLVTIPISYNTNCQ